MFKKLSVRLAAYVMVVLVSVVAVFSVIYSFNSKEWFVSGETKVMTRFFSQLQEISFTSGKEKIDKLLEEYSEQSYDLYISDAKFNTYYSTRSSEDTVDIIRESIAKKTDEFTKSQTPVYEKNKDNERIVIKCRLQKKREYFVLLEQSLKTSDSVFNYTNNFLIRIVVVFILATTVAVFLLMQKTTSSLRKLSRVAKKLSLGDFSVRYEGKITSDEVGVLAKNVNFMADTIAKSINDLNNYNFLLKEDNNRMSEYEKMRKRVLTNITHELKTPLAIISSQIEMMNIATDEQKKMHYYNSALEEIEKMSSLISRLLNFSAGEKHIFENEKMIIMLDRFVQELVDKCSVFVASRGFEIKTDLANCLVDASPEHIEHIFNNYLMNAVQFATSGSTIEVSLETDGDRCRLKVFNIGSGIKDEDAEKIWTDFYKTKGQQTDDSRSGVGLFIVKEISIINSEDCGFVNRDGGVEFWYEFKIKDEKKGLKKD